MTKSLLLSFAALAALSAPAAAQQYVSGSVGLNMQTDSDNEGAFSRDFVTGDGVAVPPGAVLPAGTGVGWTTEFDSGLFVSAAYGYRLNEMFRVEAELSYQGADVDTHTDVQAGGSALGAADAAVLITGYYSPTLRDRAIEAGFLDVVEKSSDPQEVLEKLALASRSAH